MNKKQIIENIWMSVQAVNMPVGSALYIQEIFRNALGQIEIMDQREQEAAAKLATGKKGD